MRVASTCHREGYEAYGFRWEEGKKNWPKAEFRMYAEGFDSEYRCENLPRLVAFKEQYKHYVPPLWEFDVVRYSNKVFAAYDAFYDYQGLCVWLDADCVTHRKLPRKFVESLLPDGHYMALFQRTGYHTETGFWMHDGRHPEHKAFWDTWIAWFETGKFRELRQWHDCTTLDATVRLFERDGRIKTTNLSGAHHKDMHPMSKVELGKYLDHCKGPRKALGRSPENVWHK